MSLQLKKVINEKGQAKTPTPFPVKTFAYTPVPTSPTANKTKMALKEKPTPSVAAGKQYSKKQYWERPIVQQYKTFETDLMQINSLQGKQKRFQNQGSPLHSAQGDAGTADELGFDQTITVKAEGCQT